MPTLCLAYRTRESECRYANLNEGKWPNRLSLDKPSSVESPQEAFGRVISRKSSLSPGKLSIKDYKTQIEKTDVHDRETDPFDWAAREKTSRWASSRAHLFLNSLFHVLTEFLMPDNSAMTLPDINPDLPNVLLIGDSISVGYTLPVRAQLKGQANVFRPLINGGSTIRGMELLDEWLGDRDWSVIHFNFGLHDLKYMDGDGAMADPPESGTQQVSIDVYESNLDKIVVRLQQTGAYLIWCSTTPVPEGSSGRIKGDADRYNGVASRVAAKHNLAVNDLYSFALERLGSIQRPANVHFTDDGSAVLGSQVVVAILGGLERQ